MDFMKKAALALCLSMPLATTAPNLMAAGKIANATAAEVAEAIDKTIQSSEETLAAIKSGADKNSVMAMFKTTKQHAKKIESTVTFSIRDKGLARLKTARSAFKKENMRKAEDYMAQAIDIFKKTKAKYHNF